MKDQRKLQDMFEQDLPVRMLSTPTDHDYTVPDDRTGQSAATTGRTARTKLRRRNKKMSRQLLDAAEVGDSRGMEDCIAGHADVDYQSQKKPPERNGMAAVHLAVINGHLHALEILIAKRANLNAIEPSHNNTALHYAASNGYSAIAEALVRSGANIDARDNRGQTPLLLATSETIQTFLLEAGANPNIRGIDAQSALHFAASFGLDKAVRLLIAKKADVDARNTFEQTPLWLACANTGISEDKSVAIAQLLIQSGASPRAISKKAQTTPFDKALNKDRPQLVKLLLENGADPLSRPSGELYPLHRAARYGHVRVLDELVPYYGSIDIPDRRNDDTALHVAIAFDREGCTRYLLDKKAQLSTANKDGLAPVHLAFDRSHAEICEAVLEEHARRGVLMDLPDKQLKRLPIFWARNAEAVAIWVKYKGVLAWQGRDGIPLLHHAVLYHDVTVVEALIQHGASCDTLDKMGYNALEALCVEEARWAETFNERLAILRFLSLSKHIDFTEKCRTIITRWKNKPLQTSLSKQLPRRSATEMAAVAANYVPLPLLATAAYGAIRLWTP